MLTNKKSLWLSGPYLVWIAGFILLPLCTILYYGFTTAEGHFTFANIVNAVTDTANIKAVGLTMLLAVTATAICLLLGYPLALCLSKVGLKRQKAIIFLFILPMWMNFMLQMVAINVILEDNGIINTVLSALGLERMHIANTTGAILIGMVYDYFPFMLLPIYNTVSRLDGDLVNASKDLGAGPIRTFFKITFPLSFPGLVSGATMVFIPAISDFAIAEMLGGGKIMLVGNIVEMNFTKGHYYQGSGLAILLMAFVIISSLVFGDDGEAEGGCRSAMKKLPGILRGVYIALIFVLLYLPVAVMIGLSFNQSRSAYAWEGFSVWKYEKLFSNDTIMEALGTTLLLGLASAALATLIGTLACIGMMAMRKRVQKTVTTVANIPLLNADIVTGVSLMLFFSAVVGRMSHITLLFSHITLILPYVVLNVYPKLSQFDGSVYEAALDLGASPMKAFFKVLLPDIFPGVLTGFLLALTISLDDFTITYFTKGQGLNTLSTLIYTNRIRGILPEYYALAALTFIAVLFLILVIQIVNMRTGGNSRPVNSKGLSKKQRSKH